MTFTFKIWPFKVYFYLNNPVFASFYSVWYKTIFASRNHFCRYLPRVCTHTHRDTWITEWTSPFFGLWVLHTLVYLSDPLLAFTWVPAEDTTTHRFIIGCVHRTGICTVLLKLRLQVQSDRRPVSLLKPFLATETSAIPLSLYPCVCMSVFSLPHPFSLSCSLSSPLPLLHYNYVALVEDSLALSLYCLPWKIRERGWSRVDDGQFWSLNCFSLYHNAPAHI